MRDSADAEVTEQDPDALLVARASAGDREAFAMLYRRYWRRIHSVARRFTTAEADAEDLAQEVFIKAYRALPRFRGQCRFYTWLFQITRNAGISHRTRSVEMEAIEDASLVHDLGPEETCMAEQRLKRTVSAIDDLSAPLRQALVLSTMRGFEYTDVSRLGECPLGTARSRIFRARKMLEEAVG